MITFNATDKIYLTLKYRTLDGKTEYKAGTFLNIGDAKEEKTITIYEVSEIVNSGIGKLIQSDNHV